MNVAIVVVIVIQIITYVVILTKHKNNKKEFDKTTDLKIKKDMIDMKTELYDLKRGLSNVRYELGVSTRMIDRLIDNVDILDVDDIEVDYIGSGFHYNQRLTGTSNTKYITNTFVRIDGVVYVITSGKILDDSKYEYELISLYGGYLW